jgi:hypothetical protein
MKLLFSFLLALSPLLLPSCTTPEDPCDRPAFSFSASPLLRVSPSSPSVRGSYAMGWKGDDGSKPVRLMSPRDWPLKVPAAHSDLRQYTIPALDQGDIGSCVGHGTALAWTIDHFKRTGKHLPLSRLMIYYNARVAIGEENADSGCQIIDAVNSLRKVGSCDERLWPYDTRRFRFKPCPDRYEEALDHRVIRSFKVDNTDGTSIRLALTNGYPVVVGSLVYSAIQDLRPGYDVLPMPRKGERPSGGHCYVIVGHDDVRRLYLIQNSWGRAWGNNGFAWFPYDYIHTGRITEDCHILEEVMTEPAPH